MVYGYIRVSTEKQDFLAQKFGIEKYCEFREIKVNFWIEEKKSGTVPREKRDLGILVEKLADGDKLISTELSRIGRSPADTLTTLELLKKKNVEVHLIKENLVSGTSTYDLMCALFAAIAGMERQRISERTKEALAAKKAQGMIIGHYKGFKCTNVKLTPYADEISTYLDNGKSIKFIADNYNVKWITARNFIRDRLHYDLNKIESCIKYRTYMNLY